MQAAGRGVDHAGGQAPGWIGEERGEHGGLLQAADPCLRAGDPPRAVAVRCGGGGVAWTWLPPCGSVIAIPGRAPARNWGSHRSRSGGAAWRAISRP